MTDLQILPKVPDCYNEYLYGAESGEKYMQTVFKKLKVVKQEFVKIDYAELIFVNDIPKIAAPTSKE